MNEMEISIPSYDERKVALVAELAAKRERESSPEYQRELARTREQVVAAAEARVPGFENPAYELGDSRRHSYQQALDDENIRQSRIAGDAIRAQNVAAAEAKRKADEKQRNAELTAAANEEEAIVKTRMRGVYPGAPAQFEQRWPEMWAAHCQAEAERKSRDGFLKKRAEYGTL